jgi:ABC-type Fe3+-hydroxamate transport system, periplasmic component
MNENRLNNVLLFFAFALFFMYGCGAKKSRQEETSVADQKNLMRYAQNVLLFETPQGYCMDVKNPWDSTVWLGRFLLLPDSLEAPAETQGRTVIRVPVKSVISFSATQWSAMLKFGELGKLKGILESRYTNNETILERLSSGKLLDVGTESDFDIEKMIQIKPDIILYSPYFDGNQQQLELTKAVLFPYADYLETTPLGRAEWLRVIGYLVGHERDADFLFDEIETRYLQLKTFVTEVETRPTVFSDKAFNGQWYVAGGKSYMAQLFDDAGADYIWKSNGSTASFPLDTETILSKAKEADFWRITNASDSPLTYQLLGDENELYTLFDAYRNRHVIVCDIKPTSYFEQSQFEPDLLLADFIYCFHPEMMTGIWSTYQPKYYKLLSK